MLVAESRSCIRCPITLISIEGFGLTLAHSRSDERSNRVGRSASAALYSLTRPRLYPASFEEAHSQHYLPTRKDDSFDDNRLGSVPGNTITSREFTHESLLPFDRFSTNGPCRSRTLVRLRA